MTLSQWWKQLRCRHQWIILYRGNLQIRRRCWLCGKEQWIKV